MYLLKCRLGCSRYSFSHYKSHLIYMFDSNEKIIKCYVLYGTDGKGMSAVTDRAYLPAGIQFIFHCSVSGMWHDAPPGLCSYVTSRYFKGNGIIFWRCAKICFHFICGLMYMYTAESFLDACIPCHNGINDIQHQENPVTFLNVWSLYL